MIQINNSSKNGFNKKKVLLVEDDHAVSHMLSLILETRGYKVETAYSAAEAYSKVSDVTNLILLDLGLPDEDGFDVCIQLKRQKKTAHIPIIILSAKMLSGDIVEGLYLGADDYLTKPFENEELVARMEAVMRRSFVQHDRQLARENEERIIKELKKIINDEAVTPYFQPIYHLHQHKLIGVEALCRPSTQDSLLSNPEILFKAALQYGLYKDLEMLSWKKAIEYAAQYLNNELLFLNCNPYLLEGPKFLTFKSMFEKSGIRLENVVLEITERSEITNFKEFYNYLVQFREQGFRFAVDDVGGGYASLESIVETKPEVVKIDRHIIQNITDDIYKKSIVKFIVAFCKENQILSIAEGIETKEDLKTIIELGVDAGQGYYLYRPSPKIDLQDINQKLSILV